MTFKWTPCVKGLRLVVELKFTDIRTALLLFIDENLDANNSLKWLAFLKKLDSDLFFIRNGAIKGIFYYPKRSSIKTKRSSVCFELVKRSGSITDINFDIYVIACYNIL